MAQRGLESLLTDWRAAGLPFNAKPELVREFRGGKSNRSFLIFADERHWVLRIDGDKSSALGIDRGQELQVHQAAARAGIAPEILATSPGCAFIVTRFVDGPRIVPAGISTKSFQSILATVDAVRGLDVETSRIDYRAHLSQYAAGAPLPSQLTECLAHIEADAVAGLCHHDPTPENFVFANEQPMLIDWEYAAYGYPVMDLAAIVCEWRIDVGTVAAMSEISVDLLEDACVVYRSMCALWGDYVSNLYNPK